MHTEQKYTNLRYTKAATWKEEPLLAMFIVCNPNTKGASLMLHFSIIQIALWVLFFF